MENLPISKIINLLPKQNVARLASTARFLRTYGTNRRRAVRKISGTVKAVSKFRPKKAMTESAQKMVKLVRILSLFPKTSQHGYPLRKRMAAKIFSEPSAVTAFKNITVGNIHSNSFFTFNPVYGGFFRDGPWHTTLFPSGQVHTIKQH